MYLKLPIFDNNKIILQLFRLNYQDNIYILSKIDSKNFIKVVCSNKIDGISYLNLFLPLKFYIIDNNLWSIYFFNYGIISDCFENNIDFFYNLEIQIKNKDLVLLKQDNYKKYETDIWKLINENLNDVKDTNLPEYWNNIILLINSSFYFIFLFQNINLTEKKKKEYYKKYGISKKIINLINSIRNIKFSINQSNLYTITEHLNYINNNEISLKNLKINNKYFIMIKENKKLAIIIDSIKGNIINDKINFDDYKWLIYPTSNININKLFINLIKNKEIYREVLGDNSFEDFYKGFNKELDDIEILKSNNFSSDFFKEIVKKYTTYDKVKNILSILFSYNTFPIKFNKLEIDETFDYILYITLYNYKILCKIDDTNNIIFNNDLNSIISNKIKVLYFNLIKMFINIINETYIFLNFKTFSDNIQKNFIKIFFYEENETIKLLKSIINEDNFINIKKIIGKKILLIDISNKLTWRNLTNRLRYLNILINNYSLIFYKDKSNKIIFPESIDNRIKMIILNPFEMFKYLKKESDFIKWIKFLDNKCSDLFINPISLESSDSVKLAKLIYYLINIKNQDINDESYKKFVDFCSINEKLILDNNRINLKIRDFFGYIKSNINLGVLAKHLTLNSDNNSIEFQEEPIPEVVILEKKLEEVTRKYRKYKKKYIKTGLSSSSKNIK